MKNKTIKYFAVILLTVLLSACNNNEQQNEENEKGTNNTSNTVVLSKEAQKNINLQVITLEEETLTGTLSISGVIKPNPDNEAIVGSLVEGRVNKVFVNIGTYVKQGEPLMLIEGLEIGEIKAAFLSAKANLDYAKTSLDRQKELFKQNISSKKSLLEAEAEFTKAEAEFLAQDKKIHSIGLDDSDIINNNNHDKGLYSVKAPISGVIVERNVIIGQLINSDVNAFRIINNSSLIAEGQLYEKDLTKINTSSNITVSINSLPNLSLNGKIQAVGDEVNSSTRTILVRATINNNNKLVKPQMFCLINIPIANNSKGIVVDEKALVRDGNNYYVFVQKDENSFNKTDVKIGSIFNEKAIIVEGLLPGDKLVVNGVFDLKAELLKDTFAEEE